MISILHNFFQNKGKEGTPFLFFFLRFNFIDLFFWLRWLAARRLSLVLARGGYSSLRCTGFSLWWLLLLQSMVSRPAGSVFVARGLQSAGSVVAHRLSCFMACGIFPDQGSNPCPLHWQADSYPLRHKGSPRREHLSTHFIRPALL